MISRIVQLIPLSEPWSIRFACYKRSDLEHAIDVEAYRLIAWALDEAGRVVGVFPHDGGGIAWEGKDGNWPFVDDDEFYTVEYFRPEASA